MGRSARSWTAPVLWRFDRARGRGSGRNVWLGVKTALRKAVEGYRSPRRFANDRRLRTSGSVCPARSAPCFSGSSRKNIVRQTPKIALLWRACVNRDSEPVLKPLPVGVAALALLLLGPHSLRADDWPQWLGPQRDSVWRETGILQTFPAGGPPICWRTPVGGGYSGPAVAEGRVYLMDRQLDKGVNNPADPFKRGVIPGSERVLCLDQATGKILWHHDYDAPYTMSYPAGPRATPLVSGGKVYTLGAEGNLFCLDAQSGAVVWSHDFKADYGVPTPLWGFSANPLLDGNRLICVVGGTNTTAVAFNKDDGKEIWRALTAKEPGYCPPVIFTAGGKRQLIVWHPESVNSLDPETGKTYWSVPSQNPVRHDHPHPAQNGCQTCCSSPAFTTARSCCASIPANPPPPRFGAASG